MSLLKKKYLQNGNNENLISNQCYHITQQKLNIKGERKPKIVKIKKKCENCENCITIFFEKSQVGLSFSYWKHIAGDGEFGQILQSKRRLRLFYLEIWVGR